MNIITKKEKIEQLEQLNSRKVVEHNDLISSVAKMDKIPLKIFELAVSYIDTNNPPKDNIIYLSKKELFTFFDVTDSNKHSRFKESISKMQDQAFFNVKEKKGNKYVFQRIVPIPFIEWNDYSDLVTIEFNHRIMPYLIELKNNFTQYAISDIMDLNRKYSIILYKWLCMSYNQFEHYQFKANRTQKQLEEYTNPKIDIQDLREITDTVDEYSRFESFNTWVLKKSIEEINEKTHFIVSYDKIKKGRNIGAIQFHISKKNTLKNENYKEQQEDVEYLLKKELKEQDILLLSAQAMQNEYTLILNENNLLFPTDFMNTEIMASLQKFVYPLYDQLKTLKGIESVKTHISYVSAKQEAYSKRNIAKYLQTSISTYLKTQEKDRG